MLEHEAESFSRDDSDIGCNCIEEFEVKLDGRYIIRSPYSSPVVCVHKKNGELHLCVDSGYMSIESVRHSMAFIRMHTYTI